ncbi:MAG: glycosyltransferase [Acidobacteriota bacterium]
MSCAPVSAIIPTRDRARRVGDAIASVLLQSLPPKELVVIDDGSRDDTRRRVASYERLARRRGVDLQLETIEPSGVSAARNRGIARATQPWVALLDSDDLWCPRKLEIQLARLAAHPHRLCHTDEVWIRNGRRVNPRRRHQKRGGRIFRDALPLCVISPSAVLLEHALLIEHGGFDESYPACEDYDLWLRITAREDVLYVDEPLVIKTGGHADQLSRTTEALDRYRIRALDNLLGTSDLEAEDRVAAIDILTSKIDVYAAGAARRGRHHEVATLRALKARWEAVL